MIQHLLEKSRIFLILLTIFYSCSKQNEKDNVERFYTKVIINDNLKKEIVNFKKDLSNSQMTETNTISIFFFKKNDTTFIEMGDYEPNFEMVNMKGIEILKKDTIYLVKRIQQK